MASRPPNEKDIFPDLNTIHFPRVSPKTKAVYLVLILTLVVILASLPLIYMDVSINAAGIVRPYPDRCIVQSLIGGRIDAIMTSEGQRVKKGDLLVKLNDSMIVHKKKTIHSEIRRHHGWLNDLDLLISHSGDIKKRQKQLATTIYRQQSRQYLLQWSEWREQLKKIKTELDMCQHLFREHIIADKELFDKKIEYSRTVAQFRTFQTNQISQWMELREKYLLSMEQLIIQRQQNEEDEKLCYILSPLSGTVQYIQDKYPGGVVSPGDNICSISPVTELVVECWITTRNIAWLKEGNKCHFRMDAFDHHYFGQLSGKILSIDDDFTLINNMPMFKIRCAFTGSFLRLKNGFTGKPGKGMSVQLRFIIARRNLWQLIFDQVDDWIALSTTKNK